jgi:CRISPR system Cascade subunit CasE
MIHLAHSVIEPRAFFEWAAHRALGPRGALDEGQALHVLLSALFGKGALQPFRLFAPERGDWSLYAYAASDAVAMADAARIVATPEMLDVLPLERLRSKPMPEVFAPGQRLGFDLRARPVRRSREDGRVLERDAFLWEALTTHGDSPDGMAAAGRTREAVYRDWLAERLTDAARIDACRLTGFQRRRAIRDGRVVEGPDATLQGVLSVEDPAAFATALAEGVGRHRAYGYGMLMLRPPDRAAPDQ